VAHQAVSRGLGRLSAAALPGFQVTSTASMSICALLGGACERDEAPATCDSVFPMPRENESRSFHVNLEHSR